MLHSAERPGRLPARLGVYLSKDVRGTFDLVACAFGGGRLLGVATGPTDAVLPGKSSIPIRLTLIAGMTSPFCDVGGTGGAGGAPAGTGGDAGFVGGGASGTGGTAGSAGSGGSTAGSGGSGADGGGGGSGGGGAGIGGGSGGIGGGGGLGGSCDLSKPFGAPVPVPVINSSFDEYAIWLSRDGLSAVIASNRSDLGGRGDYDLYRTTRSATTDDFGLPTLLPNVNTADAETKPVLSPNGLNLFFSSDRPGLGTGHDVYVASRSSLSANFGAPALVPAASSTVSDLLHSVTADARYLYFDRPVTGAGRDIFVMNLTTGGAPTLVPELNSQYDEGHAILSDDLLTIYFASTRIGLSTSEGSGPANILTAHRIHPDRGLHQPGARLGVEHRQRRNTELPLAGRMHPLHRQRPERPAPPLGRRQAVDCPSDSKQLCAVYREVKNDHTSAGTQVQGHVVEQLLGGVAHELNRSPVPSTTALPWPDWCTHQRRGCPLEHPA